MPLGPGMIWGEGNTSRPVFLAAQKRGDWGPALLFLPLERKRPQRTLYICIIFQSFLVLYPVVLYSLSEMDCSVYILTHF